MMMKVSFVVNTFGRSKAISTAVWALLALFLLGSNDNSNKIGRVIVEANELRTRRMEIVILGDSYIAGNGARAADGTRNYNDAECYTSPTNWVGLYIECLRAGYANNGENLAVKVVNAACSGSFIQNVAASQLDSITSNTNLVFLTVGGNDLGFAQLLQTCYYLAWLNLTQCEELFDDYIEVAVDVFDRFKALLQAIVKRIPPGAKVVVVGYPYLSLDVDIPIVNLNPFQVFPIAEKVRESGILWDRLQEIAVDQVNEELKIDTIVFENIKTLFDGHEPHPLPGVVNRNRWIHEFEPIQTLGFTEENYHYNALGHQRLGLYLCGSRDYGVSQSLVPDPRCISCSPIAVLGSAYVGFSGPRSLPTRFDASGSYGIAGTIATYMWDLDGDGIFDVTTTVPYYEHQYFNEFIG